jgi:hypothetical protein
MTQQQQLEKRSSQPLTLPQPSDLAAAIGRDWREPKKLQLAFDSWVKLQHPVIEVITATLAGSGQVRLEEKGRACVRVEGARREKAKRTRENRNQCSVVDGCGETCCRVGPCSVQSCLVFSNHLRLFFSRFQCSVDTRKAVFSRREQQTSKRARIEGANGSIAALSIRFFLSISSFSFAFLLSTSLNLNTLYNNPLSP